jgi:sulfur-oxidizing protein SoxZ
MAQARINFPAKVKRGETFEIKTLVSHVMETGFRRTETDEVISRDIVTDFVCSYNGEKIFSATLHPAMSANPYISFYTTATESGSLTFTWTGDNNFAVTESAKITVE